MFTSSSPLVLANVVSPYGLLGTTFQTVIRSKDWRETLSAHLAGSTATSTCYGVQVEYNDVGVPVANRSRGTVEDLLTISMLHSLYYRRLEGSGPQRGDKRYKW